MTTGFRTPRWSCSACSARVRSLSRPSGWADLDGLVFCVACLKRRPRLADELDGARRRIVFDADPPADGS